MSGKFCGVYSLSLVWASPRHFWSQDNGLKGTILLWPCPKWHQLRSPVQPCHPQTGFHETHENVLGAKLYTQTDVVFVPALTSLPAINPLLPPIKLYRYNEQKHLKVLKLNGHYGFSEEMCVHASLLDLVLHYSEHSLKTHNKQLTTTLQFPINADK